MAYSRKNTLKNEGQKTSQRREMRSKTDGSMAYKFAVRRLL